MRRLIAVTIAGLLLAFSLWPSPAEAGENLKKVKLAYAGWGIGAAIGYVGVDAGLFKKYDLDVREVLIADAFTGGVQALVGVDFVLGFGNPIIFLQPILEGADIVFLGSHVNMEQYELGVSSDIATLKDLKGKKIGVSALGRKSDLITRVLLRRAGLDPLKDAKIVGVGFSPDRAVALSKNLIQAAPLSPGIASEAKKLGLKVLDIKDVPVITSLLMTTRSFIERDRETVNRFVKAYLASIHYYLTRPAESIAIIKKYLATTEPDAAETVYGSFAAQLRPLPTVNGEAVQALIDAISVADERAKSLKESDLFDSRFLEELKSSGFIKDLYSEKVSL